MAVAGPTGVTTVAAGYQHSLALAASGDVWAWGDNLSGQLGDGTTTSRATPAVVAGMLPLSGLATGKFHAVVSADDGAGTKFGSTVIGASMPAARWRSRAKRLGIRKRST